jgi:hypothetical protein
LIDIEDRSQDRSASRALLWWKQDVIRDIYGHMLFSAAGTFGSVRHLRRADG